MKNRCPRKLKKYLNRWFNPFTGTQYEHQTWKIERGYLTKYYKYIP